MSTYTTPSSISITNAVGASGATGNYLFNNNGGINWGAGTISVSASPISNTLNVKGDANFQGDVTIKGKSIVDSLERIEERLAILRPNDELEEKWENLRGLRKAYMELEAEIKEKEKVWGILKK